MEKETMNFKEVCQFLDVSKPTMLKLIRKGIPGRKVGGKWVFVKAGLIDWLNSGNTKDNRRKKEGQ